MHMITENEKKIIEILVDNEIDKRTAMVLVESMDTKERRQKYLQFLKTEKTLTRQKAISEALHILDTIPSENEMTLSM